jgi:hypothetical protein
MAKSIAIIFHENERIGTARKYAVWHLAEIWRKNNFKIIYLFGIQKYVPADLAILHVDLSVVPDTYIDFASRYPVVLNGEIRDIRKSTFSEIRVTANDAYQGPVIVKSDLNFAGEPERKLLGNRLSRLARRIEYRLASRYLRANPARPRFRLPNDYRIYDSVHSVPREWFNLHDVLVEKFIPEMNEGHYCQRVYHFLGTQGVCVFRRSKDPIVNPSKLVSREKIEVYPEIAERVKRMKFDYGKFDYVMHEGKPILLDANKTPGAADNPAFYAMCSEWAKGIEAYL